ncbi:hypothetical protein [Gloeocapsopsis dulcis]|uniref:Uncharacterized protein n=1 Tax=Gloeocapsopsis dulcis AAB1 = 1H9 TaxID=1433147 RepID=A0A6N8FSS5_9CHRO|nr:hypothetical protein [Gloeocapsopsis dulcis]MUL34996.1 hypothetical protein [Gloeocapsopsis dulcis AAB1 = 1H9]WNN89929.1 hypothetical protein P0S91_02185 [Gloeocapsopsis dulcis]
MKVWLACFFLLFALAELFQWAKQFSFPLPIYILGGAFLAIASNYDKLGGLRSLAHHEQPIVNSASQPSITDSTAQPLNSIFAAQNSEQPRHLSRSQDSQ